MLSIQPHALQTIDPNVDNAAQHETLPAGALAVPQPSLANARPDTFATTACRANSAVSGWSDVGLVRPNVKALPLTAAAWSPLPGLPEVVPWHEADEALRSCAGLNAGVYFLSLHERDIAAKMPAHPEREVAASWLAQAVGLNVPATRLEWHVPAHVRQLLPRGPETALLVMERVRGHHFGELRPGDVEDLCLATPRGKRLCASLGRIMAYDYLIGNPDRFPMPGLNGTNRGNVMLAGDDIWCIDNTLPTPGDLLDLDWLSNLHRGQDLLFSLLPGAPPCDAATKLARFVGFFDEQRVNWTDIGPSVLAGATDQCFTMARVEDTRLAPALDMLAATPGGSPLASFVRDNLARFRAACGKSGDI